MLGSMKSIAGGKMTLTAGKIRVESSGENLQLHSAQDTVFKAKGKITYNTYTPDKGATHNLVRGYWTDREDQPITEAVTGDIVRFHIETRGIPNGAFVFFTLYDKDRQLFPGEDGTDDPIAPKRPRVNELYDREIVNGGKVVITVQLSYLESLLKGEEDRMPELYYRVSYRDQSINLPRNAPDYLKVLMLPPILGSYSVGLPRL